MAYTGYERYKTENDRTARRADANIRRVQQNVRQDQLAKKQARRDHKAKMEQYINAMPEGFEATQLPQKYQASIEKFLHAGKDKYANAAMEIQSYEPGTEEYQFYKDQMTSVTNSFKTAKAQTDLFGTNKKDMAIDLSNGTYSKGNDIGEMGLLTSVYTDEQDMMFNENGTIGFSDGEGNVTNFNELPDYFNKDFKTGDAIQKMATTLYGKGQALNPATETMTRNQLQSMIEQGGTETLYSLANDDFFNNGGLGIPDNILKDPNRRDEVEDMVIDQYMNVMRQQASSGVTYKPKSKKKITNTPMVNQWIVDNKDNPNLTKDEWSRNVFAGTKYYLEPAYVSADSDEIKGYYIIENGRRSGEGEIYTPDLTTGTMGPIIEKLKI
jgi:hypothetical protein